MLLATVCCYSLNTFGSTMEQWRNGREKRKAKKHIHSGMLEAIWKDGRFQEGFWRSLSQEENQPARLRLCSDKALGAALKLLHQCSCETFWPRGSGAAADTYTAQTTEMRTVGSLVGARIGACTRHKCVCGPN